MVATEVLWTPQNETEKAAAMKSVTKQVQYLRDLVPDSGVYVNEVRFFPCLIQIRLGKRGSELTSKQLGEYQRAGLAEHSLGH